MNSKFQKLVRDKLTEQHQDLVRDSSELSKRLSSLYQSAERDDEAQMVPDASEDVLHYLGTRESDELAAIEEALARLEDGSYGRCVRCDGTIAEARLQAMPATRHCMPCQEFFERQGYRSSAAEPVELWG